MHRVLCSALHAGGRAHALPALTWTSEAMRFVPPRATAAVTVTASQQPEYMPATAPHTVPCTQHTQGHCPHLLSHEPSHEPSQCLQFSPSVPTLAPLRGCAGTTGAPLKYIIQACARADVNALTRSTLYKNSEAKPKATAPATCMPGVHNARECTRLPKVL